MLYLFPHIVIGFCIAAFIFVVVAILTAKPNGKY